MRFSAPLIVSLALISLSAIASPPHIRVGFYNVCNLYDTINDIGVDDGDNTLSEGEYRAKVDAIGRAVKIFRPTILGLCEVENRGVVADLALQTGGVVLHYDSRDRRGIDVALIVDTAVIEVVSSEPVVVGGGVRDFLRADLIDKDSQMPLTVYLLHLPSQRGGVRADKFRARAHFVIDSLSYTAPNVIFVGDFNNAPFAWGNLHNTALEPAKKGVGSYGYRDVWTMIDQILVSKSLLPYVVDHQRVVLDASLLNSGGRYHLYPNREVSDHLPIYLDLKL